MGRHSRPGGPVRLVLTLSVLVVFAVAIVFALSGCATVTPEEAVAAGHPTVAKDTPCTSCKAKDHQFEHRDPYKGDCRLCHDTQSWNQVFYSHANVAFNEGMHLAVGCDYCHTEQNPYPSANCSGCHASQHPVVLDCAKCHQAVAWRLPTLPKEHVSLKGGHKDLECFDCHKGDNAFSLPNGCASASCHGPSKHGGLTDCASCHDPSLGWKPKKSFDHNDYFVLSGRHKQVECTQCHPNNQFAAANPQCTTCHGVKHGGLTNCSACHTTEGFTPSTFKHSSVWKYYTGAHKNVACTKCHPSAQYAKHIGNKNSCVSCHGTKHGGLSKCADCHTTSAFKPSTFEHSSVWQYYTGAHKNVACTKCHPSAQYAKHIGNADSCVSCHGVQHGGLSDCLDCHTTSTFKPSTFKHFSVWQYYTGAHKNVACTKCHPDGQYAEHIGNADSCVSCHGVQHGGLSDCLDCHTTSTFKPSTFEHFSVWQYYTGAHKNVACTKCHPDGQYAEHIGNADSCVSCHGVQHGGLSDCLDCHTTSTFKPSTFEHSSVWPLTGAHQTLACTKCHPGSEYANAIGDPSSCGNCHGVMHGNQTQCDLCHTTSTFSEVHLSSEFTHAEIGYHTGHPIQDVCLECHTTGNFTEYVCNQCHFPFPYP